MQDIGTNMNQQAPSDTPNGEENPTNEGDGDSESTDGGENSDTPPEDEVKEGEVL
jgi:hypothetical protein